MNKQKVSKSFLFSLLFAIIAFIIGFFVPAGSLIMFIGMLPFIFRLVKYSKANIEQSEELKDLNSKLSELQKLNDEITQKMESIGFTTYDETMKEVDRLNGQIGDLNEALNTLISRNEDLTNKNTKIEKQIKTSENKLLKEKELYNAIQYAINTYYEYDSTLEKCKLTVDNETFYDELAPTVTLRIHSMDVKSLNKAYRDNDSQITKLLEQYKDRYATKTNKAIYSLIVIGLRSELQNILTNLKYDKLENAIEQIKTVTNKYISIAGEGNQTIAATLIKFIGATEYLFINAAKIEYDYYIKKEKARQEQIALREKMRQEAQERKELEAEKKKIEAEESKYKKEIEKIRQQLLEASEAEKTEYEKRIIELQSQLSDIVVKKDTIVNLQNGKAGNIYIISNLGSFGENVFKIGMTRRLEPQERVDELGSASVPFKFDVHSFIFSDDAVSLEKTLHDRLNEQRVNKVNLRKEFFNSSVDELEKIVGEIDPTAEFNKTMLAEEYRQSLTGEIIDVQENVDDSE